MFPFYLDCSKFSNKSSIAGLLLSYLKITKNMKCFLNRSCQKYNCFLSSFARHWSLQIQRQAVFKPFPAVLHTSRVWTFGGLVTVTLFHSCGEGFFGSFYFSSSEISQSKESDRSFILFPNEQDDTYETAITTVTTESLLKRNSSLHGYTTATAPNTSRYPGREERCWCKHRREKAGAGSAEGRLTATGTAVAEGVRGKKAAQAERCEIPLLYENKDNNSKRQ